MEKRKSGKLHRCILLTAAFSVFVFAATRFSFSQLAQSPQGMAVLTGVLTVFQLYFLYRYLKAPNDRIGREEEGTPLFSRSDQRYFGTSLLFYIMASLTCEGCIGLVILFYPALLLKLKKEEKESRKEWMRDTLFLWLSPAAAAVVLLLLYRI